MKFNPAVIIIDFLFLIIAIIFFTNPIMNLIIFLYLSFLVIKLDNLNSLINIIKFSLMFFLIGIFINCIIGSNGSTLLFRTKRFILIGRIDIYLEELLYSILMFFKIISMFLIFKSYKNLIDEDEFFDFLSKYLKKLSLTISITYNIMFRLKDEITRIKDVMVLRGVDFFKGKLKDRIKNFYFLAKILIISSLEGSIDYSEAIYSKEYNSSNKKSYYTKLSFEKKDYLFLFLTFITFFTVVLTYKTGNLFYDFYPKLVRLENKDFILGLYVFTSLSIKYLFLVSLKSKVEQYENI
ncbi:MAG: energy-coupling factor transporter transmembrane protein EcfT [Peptostreptococcaceae bacterium]|nr:energy-coupling factor transporter transmembrane protein EcfT [Peptostreptococcaceae bacterium]